MNIKDIARICEVSPSTVSKILHGKDGDISDATRKRVLEAVKEYQYVPYSKVIQNASYKSNMIGVLLPGEAHGAKELLYAIEQAASERGYSVLLCNTEGDEKKVEKYIHIFQNKNVDGLIHIFQKKKYFKHQSIPSVGIRNQRNHRMNEEFAQIYYEEEEAAYLAVKYLVEKGHTRISCILGERDDFIEAGCTKAFQENHLLLNKELIFKGDWEEIRDTGITKYLDMGSTAVICANVEIGNMVYERLRERGVSVPDNISVLSVRDGALAEQVFPKMTAVNIPFGRIGFDAVNSLIEMIEKHKSVYECSKKEEVSIIERNSVKQPMKHTQGEKIVVVGSMNMDCMISVSHIPTNGETINSGAVQFLPGGKGANQAVGVGKLDGQVYMIGCLGNDKDGKEIYNSLVSNGVKMEAVVFDDVLATGKAYVNVASDGESTIVVYPGANIKLDRSQIQKFGYLLDEAKYCLLSSEISEDAVEYTIQKCNAKNVEVIMKPSAVDRMKESLFEKIDYFIPNEKEIKQLVPQYNSIEEKADLLFQKGVKNIIVTLGQKGCYLKNETYSCFFEAADFYPVDTTGGADAFISAFATYMSEGHDIISSIGFATYAAGICITRVGVQTALSTRPGLELYADEIRSKFLKQ